MQIFTRGCFEECINILNKFFLVEFGSEMDFGHFFGEEK